MSALLRYLKLPGNLAGGRRRHRALVQAVGLRCMSTKITKNNIILMGSPGCGKTTLGRILSSKLDRPVIDIDDDHLEPLWGMPVSEKLQEVGSEGFVQAEGEALCKLQTDNSIISLTGSNPMHEEGMEHVAKTGVVVYLDVHPQDILERLERMKVNRIVGQNEGTPMADILAYRQQFYEKSYDVRVTCTRNEDPQSVADKVVSKLNYTMNNPGYISTRQAEVSNSSRHSLNDVMINSLCHNGGLYVPKIFPSKLSIGELDRLLDLNYRDRALRIIENFIPWQDIHPKTIRQFVNKAYSDQTFGSDLVFPLYPLVTGSGQYLLELFHGPTASFKDAALQLLPQLFQHAVSSVDTTNSRYLILVATSGDTGGAVLDGFSKHADDVRVLVLYPQDGVSSIQKQQMISLSNNRAKAVGVKSWDFDACQTAVKSLLNNNEFKESLCSDFNTKLSAANSISWGRLLPQIVYHVASYLDLVRTTDVKLGDEADLCVPTGNFGNILAAFYAKKLGIPYSRLICASNSNNVLTDFINTGTYDLRSRYLQMTSSPAIDILVSSNLERLLYHISSEDTQYVKQLYEDLKSQKRFTVTKDIMNKVQSHFIADWSNEETCASTVSETLKKHGYLLDTHTAVGKAVADRYPSDRPTIIASTAHPSKFAGDILHHLGIPSTGMNAFEMLEEIDKLSKYPVKHKRLSECLKDNKQGEIIDDPSLSRIKAEIENMSKYK